MKIHCSSCFLALAAVHSFWLALPVVGTLANAAAPITPSGLNTQISAPVTLPNGQTQYNITGGTRPGGGTNLFHSFGDFNVPTNNIANFLNDSGLATSNILGRVTLGNPSIIYGTIQTNGPGGFGNANLFLMNPAGFLFGPNATLNVGGMVAFTSADYLKLADGGRFNANPNAIPTDILTAAPVASFGFLGSNPGAITVQGSQLSVTPGQSISLVGGNITIQSGTLEDGTVRPARLSAPGGQINLASVTSPGEILLPNLQFAPNINGQSFTAMGNISLSQGALLDVSADAAGTVRIRGGELVIADATISANTGTSNGSPLAVDINLAGDLTFSDTRDVPAITGTSSGFGNAGEVQIVTANVKAVQVTTPNPGFTGAPIIDSHSSSDGRAGDVSISTGNLTVTSPGPKYFIDSGPQGNGHGGDITIIASNHIELKNAYISTGTQQAEILGLAPSTSSGNLSITVESLQANGAILDTHATTVFEETQSAGNITLNIRDIYMVNTQVNATAAGRGGAITINADRLITDNTLIQSFNILAPGGGISFTGGILELTNGSNWSTSTLGDFKAGDILVNATGHVSLIGITGELGRFNPSGLFSNSLGGAGTQGAAGNIIVTTPRLTMQGGRINTSTATSGTGGNVTINAGVIEMSGEFPNPDFGGFFGITNIHPSGIFTQTVGSEFCSGPCGNAGNINITTASLQMGAGSQIDSGTTNTGYGGDITIQAANQISMSGTLSDGSPVGVFSRTIGADPGSGNGGKITLSSGQSVTISDGAAISASSIGPGNTGNIQINAGNTFTMTNSSVTTQANQASGGIIKITTNPSGTVQLTNSSISASVLDGTGGGGSVNIDPQFVILQNSQILAQAVQGPGGNISITTNLLLPDATSVISASSQFGQNGTITIQSPISPASGKIMPLSQRPLLPTALLSQRCAALAGGEFSSFTVAGRDNLPAEPGGWLSSPLALSASKSGVDTQTEASSGTIEDEQAEEPPLLSLRQIAPPGFLTQAFAVDWSAGCTS
jgi:filamentous hemagglutinin family protein